MGIQSDIRDHLLPQPASFKKKKEYQIEELLGRGGFGKVLKAKWTPKDGEKKDVALKIINKALVKDNDQVMDEIHVLEGLDHPNIVHVWDHFESRDKYYIAFELAVGGELFDRISSRGRFTEKDAMECIRQVLLATAYLHSHRIVHRDLKPENIIYKTKDPNSPLVVADFGIAKHLSDEGEDGEELFNAAGSFGYAAPEVLLGKGHGMKVDCWSVGVIAYTLLCGYAPFRSTDKAELIRESTKGKVQFHERYWRKVSQTAKDFVKAMIQVDPKIRLSAEEALNHPWLLSCNVTDHNLAPGIKEHFAAKKKWNKAFLAISAANRLRSGSNSANTTPALPSLPTPSQSPKASPPAQGDTLSPHTPSSAHLATPTTSSTGHRSYGSGALTPLSMSEDEMSEGFVTADEDNVGRSEAVTSSTSPETGVVGGSQGQLAGLESAKPEGHTPEAQDEVPVLAGEPVSAGGLRGMMGRLGLGR